MNIFILDYDMDKSVQYYVDKHVVKMVLETAQLLCSSHYFQDPIRNDIPYKLSHKNHPCSIWVRESLSNYFWLLELGYKISEEYTYRYGKDHKCNRVFDWCLENIPDLKDNGLTPFALAINEDFRIEKGDVVDKYRHYYKYGKKHIHSWKKRERPWWL